MSYLKLIMALIAVESGGDDNAIGDGGKALGCLQIHAIYVRDVNRIAGTEYTHTDAFDRVKSITMTGIYLAHYGKRYTRITGKPVTYEVLARIHNGGPDGWKKPATLKSWKKVRKVMVQ